MVTVVGMGLKIPTRRLAIRARRSLRISSSVFPENMEPQITSIHPRSVKLSGGLYKHGPAEFG